MSGALLLRAFADVNPDALNWGNINAAPAWSGSNADQTISGITAPISLKVTYTEQGLWELGYHLNGGGYVALATGDTFTVSDGDTVHFEAVGDNVDPVIAALVTVMNHTVGDATLDTFNVSLGV